MNNVHFAKYIFKTLSLVFAVVPSFFDSQDAKTISAIAKDST
jgi:hypothetical protein